jgi:hypothetical protein
MRRYWQQYVEILRILAYFTLAYFGRLMIRSLYISLITDQASSSIAGLSSFLIIDISNQAFRSGRAGVRAVGTYCKPDPDLNSQLTQEGREWRN